MSVNWRILSLGTLPAHPLWDERGHVRTGHATTTLVESGDVRLVVDPGLPPQVLAARMSERTSLNHHDVTHVFVTNFTGDHWRGISLFPHAKLLVHETERGVAQASFEDQRRRAEDARDADLVRRADEHLALLERFEDAPDAIARGIDLFPLPGVSPGTCGILLALPTVTVVLAGDAIPTLEHYERAQVLPWCVDRDQAMESFREAIEIADLIVLGRDNVVAGMR